LVEGNLDGHIYQVNFDDDEHDVDVAISVGIDEFLGAAVKLYGKGRTARPATDSSMTNSVLDSDMLFHGVAWSSSNSILVRYSIKNRCCNLIYITNKEPNIFE